MTKLLLYYEYRNRKSNKPCKSTLWASSRLESCQISILATEFECTFADDVGKSSGTLFELVNIGVLYIYSMFETAGLILQIINFCLYKPKSLENVYALGY